MPKTPDRNVQPTEYNDESLYEDFGLPDPSTGGNLRYRNTAFRIADGLGVFDPRRSWSSYLDGAVSDVGGTVLYCVTTGTVAPSQVSWFSDAAKTKLVATLTYTYSVVNPVFPVTIVAKIFNLNGSVRATATDQITWTGAFETGRTRTFS